MTCWGAVKDEEFPIYSYSSKNLFAFPKYTLATVLDDLFRASIKSCILMQSVLSKRYLFLHAETFPS